MNYWLFKSEPETYSFQTLKKDKKTVWNGVRNYQARNYLREVEKGDLALIYHSGKEKSIVGIATVTKKGYPEIDLNKKGDWVQLDIAFKTDLEPITLQTIKTTAALKSLPLIRHTRLSCMPIAEKEFKLIEKMGKLSAEKI